MLHSAITNTIDQIKNQVTHDVMLIHDMNVMVKTRTEALENVLCSGKYGFFRRIALSIAKKKYLGHVEYMRFLVDMEHERLLQQYKDRVMKAQKIEALAKSNKVAIIQP